MDKLKDMFSKLFRDDSPARLRLIILAGIAAMLLLALTDTDSCTRTQPAEPDIGQNAAQYADMLEQQLEDMIASVDGAGRTKVMVTLRNGVEYIYASEDKTSVNTAESVTNSGGQSSEAKENSENSCIIIRTGDGEQALIRTELMPTVAGIVVICEGADDPDVAARIEELVTTALNISSRHVCITLLSSD